MNKIFTLILYVAFSETILFAQMNIERPEGNGLTGNYYQGYSIDSSGVIDVSHLALAFSRIDTLFDIWNGSSSLPGNRWTDGAITTVLNGMAIFLLMKQDNMDSVPYLTMDPKSLLTDR